MGRKKIPQETEKKVLVKSKRRCAICFGLDSNTEEIEGQIAHLDQDSSNNKLQNLVFLCFKHHDKYDSTTSQSKNYTKKEVEHYRDELYDLMDLQNSMLWNEDNDMEEVQQNKRSGLSLEVYDRKIKVYRAVKEFLLYVMATAQPSGEKLHEFSEKTDEAIFLFDQKVSEYISQIYSKAVRQRYLNKRLNDRNLPIGEKRREYADEDYKISIFYSEQRKKLKNLFSKYIYLE